MHDVFSQLWVLRRHRVFSFGPEMVWEPVGLAGDVDSQEHPQPVIVGQMFTPPSLARRYPGVPSPDTQLRLASRVLSCLFLHSYASDRPALTQAVPPSYILRPPRFYLIVQL